MIVWNLRNSRLLSLDFPTGLFHAVTLFLELHWLKDPVGEEKQSLAESRKKWLSEVTKDLWVAWLPMRWEPQMSVQAVITQVLGTMGAVQQALRGCAWSGSMRLSSAFSSLSTFASQDDNQQSWPVFEIVWLTVLPTRQTHRNYLLIGTASAICWTCQHVSSWPKKVTPWLLALSAALFLSWS